MPLVSRPVSAGAMQFQVDFAVPAASPIFLGHYPGQPLVPGLYLVEAALQALALAGGAPRVTRLADLRLMHPVGPDETVRLLAQCVEHTEQRKRWQVSLSREGTLLARFKLDYECAVPPVPQLPGVPDVGEHWQHWSAARVASRLAHRSPILLVDEAFAEPGGDVLVAHKSVSLNEPCYGLLPPNAHDEALHYPDVLVVESFVQSSGLLVGEKARARHQVMLLGGVRSVAFYARVGPGDVLRHELRVLRRLSDTALVGGVTRVGRRVVAVVNEVLIALRSPTRLRQSPAAAAAAPA